LNIKKLPPISHKMVANRIEAFVVSLEGDKHAEELKGREAG
jgi:hypothetical protein